ncbi:hypothetical protein, partial [Salmonella enterica]
PPPGASGAPRAAGNPPPGENLRAGSGDGIASAVVIDGDSLNDSATQIGGMTGEYRGSLNDVTRPASRGSHVGHTAALYR